jgi:hypothetical protein
MSSTFDNGSTLIKDWIIILEKKLFLHNYVFNDPSFLQVFYDL